MDTIIWTRDDICTLLKIPVSTLFRDEKAGRIGTVARAHGSREYSSNNVELIASLKVGRMQRRGCDWSDIRELRIVSCAMIGDITNIDYLMADNVGGLIFSTKVKLASIAVRWATLKIPERQMFHYLLNIAHVES